MAVSSTDLLTITKNTNKRSYRIIPAFSGGGFRGIRFPRANTPPHHGDYVGGLLHTVHSQRLHYL